MRIDACETDALMHVAARPALNVSAEEVAAMDALLGRALAEVLP